MTSLGDCFKSNGKGMHDYSIGRIEGVDKYTYHEARAHMLKTEHFGPWL